MTSPKKQPDGAKKLPKPMIAFIHTADFKHNESVVLWNDVITKNPIDNGHLYTPTLMLPMPSKRAALAKKKLEAMGREQKVEAIARALFEAQQFSFAKGPWSYVSGEAKEHYLRMSRSVLSLLEGQP